MNILKTNFLALEKEDDHVRKRERSSSSTPNSQNTKLHKSYILTIWVLFSKHNLQNFKLRSMNFVTNLFRSGSLLGKPLDEFKKLYKLDKKQLLGAGGFGTTYLCKDRSTGDTYACKSILKTDLKTEELKESVKTEIRILNLLSGQPNIVQIKDAYEDKKSVHIVMELCDGGELYEKIKAVVKSRGYYSEKAAAEIFKSIMEAIQVMHTSNVIHRDVKPENFLFSTDDEDKAVLKAIDFGCSVHMEQGKRARCFGHH